MSQRCNGFTLLEVLITIVILAFGLLGVAGLQSKYLAAEMESYQRSQALVLLNDFANRVLANRPEATVVTGVVPYVTGTALGTGDSPQATCPASPISSRDKCEWSKALLGAAELSGTTVSAATKIGAMAGARGCVELTGSTPPTYRVSVAWQGLTTTKVPDLTCGKDAYGTDDGFRRVVSYQIVIPTLIDPTPP
jgi:type IV pilus assembly protein PilV